MDESRRLASIQSRAVAWIIDAFIMGSVRQLVEYLEIPNLSLIGNDELVVGGVITILMTFLYLCVLPAYLQGRTPGKLLLGIRIVALDDKPLTISRLFVRNWLGYIASSLGGMGFAWALSNRLYQTWHDMAAKTIVVPDPDGIHLLPRNKKALL